MRKTIEATWREGFLASGALVAPKVNNLYTRKSQHIVDRIQRMLRINEIAIVIGAPILWLYTSAIGIPYTGAIVWGTLMTLLIARRLYVTRFVPPDSGLDSYRYLREFRSWLTERMARSRRLQRHLYPIVFLALAIGVLKGTPGRLLVAAFVEFDPGVRLIGGVPWFIVVGVAAVTAVIELLGGKMFDFDVNLVYRGVFRKLDQMLAEMEELRS